MNIETARAWRREVTELVIFATGIFMIVFATLSIREPTVLAVVFGAAITLIGLPPVVRLDEWLRQRATTDPTATDSTAASLSRSDG